MVSPAMIFSFRLLIVVVMFFSRPAIHAGEDGAKAYEEALALGDRLDDTEEGQAYEKQFFAALGPQLQHAMKECTGRDTPAHRFRLLFHVEGGKIARVLPEPGQAVAACVAPRFVGLPAAPPPADTWVMSIRLTVKP
jgi:hypothetical protein